MSQPTRIIWNGRRKVADLHPPAIAEPPTAVVTPPVGGGELPIAPGGKVCEQCGVYVVRTDIHDRWHRGLAWHIRLMLRVFRARGYITTAEDSIATEGNSNE